MNNVTEAQTEASKNNQSKIKILEKIPELRNIEAEKNAKIDEDALASFREENQRTGYIAEYCGEPLGEDDSHSFPPPPALPPPPPAPPALPRIVPYNTSFYGNMK